MTCDAPTQANELPIGIPSCVVNGVDDRAQSGASVRGLLYGLAVLWFLSAVVRPYFAPSSIDYVSGADLFFQVMNVVAQVVAAIVLVFHRPARQELPIVGFLYGACAIALVFVRDDIRLDARSSIPLGFLAFVPFWLGRVLAAETDDGGTLVIRVLSNVIALNLLLGTVLLPLAPSNVDLSGLQGHGARTILPFNLFLGPVHVYLLANRIAIEVRRGSRVFWAIMLMYAVGCAAIGWSRSELGALALVLLASPGLRLRWVLPALVLSLAIAAQNQDTADTLRISGREDMTTGRAELQKYLLHTFEANPEIGIGRGIAGYRAKKDIGERNWGGSTEHGFVMHLAANGIAGAVFVIAIVARCLWTAALSEFAKDWSARTRANRVALASGGAMALAIIVFGSTGGLAAGSSIMDMLLLFTIGFASNRVSLLLAPSRQCF